MLTCETYQSKRGETMTETRRTQWIEDQPGKWINRSTLLPRTYKVSVMYYSIIGKWTIEVDFRLKSHVEGLDEKLLLVDGWDSYKFFDTKEEAMAIAENIVDAIVQNT